MKDLKNTLRERYDRPVLRSRGVRLFCVFFLLYVFLGLCLSNYDGYDTNMFFEADNARAFDDLVNIEGIYRHYRIVLHPLFLLLGQAVTLLVNGAVNYPTMSVLLVEACCGALSVSLFDAVLGRRKAGGRVRTLFTLIYGFSFSALIFSTVPETFIFGALGLVSYWYFLSAAAEAEGPLSGREWFLLVFFGAVNCGTTVTNYAFYMIGLLYLLLCRYPRGAAAKAFCRLNVLNAAAIAAACLYQRFVWREAPLFWEYIVHWTDPSEEGRFMDTGASAAKIKEWLAQTVCDPLLSPGMYLRNPDKEYHPILFLKHPAPIMAALLAFWVLLAVCLLAWLAGLRRRRFEAERDGFVLALLAAYGGNLALHYIYGYNEAFMYSPHYLFYILLAAPLALEQSRFPALKRVLVPGLAVFLAVETVNNLYRYAQTTRLALSTIDSTFFLPHAVKGAVLCGALLLAALLGWDRLTGNRPAAPEGDPTVRRLHAAVGAYCALVLVTSLFIAFNH